MGSHFRVIGLGRLRKDMADLVDRIEEAAHDAVEETAESTRDFAKDTLRVDTYDKGNLHDGIESDVRGLHGTIGVSKGGAVDLYYAEFVEYGTSKMEAEPFMTPAAQYASKTFRKTVAKHVRKAV